MSASKKKTRANLHLKLIEAVSSSNARKVEKVINAQNFLTDYIVQPVKLSGRNKTALHLAFETDDHGIQSMLVNKYTCIEASKSIRAWFGKVNRIFRDPEVQDSFLLVVLGVVVASIITLCIAPWFAYNWCRDGGKARARCNQIKQEVKIKKITGRKEQALNLPIKSCSHQLEQEIQALM